MRATERTDLYRGSQFLGTIPRVEFRRLKSLSFEELHQGVDRASRSVVQSCILKLGSPDQPRRIENEDFFLRMARACGLVVNDARLARDQRGTPALLIKREEPTAVSPERSRADQFVDACPSEKYPRTFSEIAEGLRVCSAPVLEIAKLIRVQAFSYLIVNGNLHARGFSLRTSPRTGRIELTPAYDLITTLPYGDQRMALKFEGRDDHLKRADFVAFGERHGVKAAATHALLDEVCRPADEWIDRLAEIGFGPKKTAHLRQVMLKRKADLQNG